jgi:hypothetical protein
MMSSASVLIFLPTGDCLTTDSLLKLSCLKHLDTDRTENIVLLLLYPIVAQQRVYMPQYEQGARLWSGFIWLGVVSRFPYNASNYLTSEETISFSRTTLPYEVISLMMLPRIKEIRAQLKTKKDRNSASVYMHLGNNQIPWNMTL